jgi:hypothetical protein
MRIVTTFARVYTTLFPCFFCLVPILICSNKSIRLIGVGGVPTKKDKRAILCPPRE